jgi:hypothetical protein
MRVIINNVDLGVVYSDMNFIDPTSSDNDSIIFPHIGIKNMKVLVNFGVELPDPDFVAWPVPAFLNGKEYKFFGELNRFSNTIVPTRRPPLSKSDCTVIFVSS